MGQECAGIVTRVSVGSLYSIGNQVLVFAAEGLRALFRVKNEYVLPIPDSMELTTAVAIPSHFSTAWQALYNIAGLKHGESVLIHAAAGGTGQAALQIARIIGARVFAAVGSRSKKEMLIRDFGIPETHIFSSRDTSFEQGVSRQTNGQGVDVVLNCLPSEALLESWNCIALYGRFVELGNEDISSNAALAMASFGKNASFTGFDGSRFRLDRPHQARESIQSIMDLFVKNVFHKPLPLQVFDISETQQAFQAFRDGLHTGKIVLQIKEQSSMKVTLHYLLCKAKTYKG